MIFLWQGYMCLLCASPMGQTRLGVIETPGDVSRLWDLRYQRRQPGANLYPQRGNYCQSHDERWVASRGRKDRRRIGKRVLEVFRDLRNRFPGASKSCRETRQVETATPSRRVLGNLIPPHEQLQLPVTPPQGFYAGLPIAILFADDY